MDLLERDDQLRRLNEAFASASAGRGRVVAITGEAGAGKTSLVERFAAEQSTRARVHWGACEHLSTPEPLLPLRDIARASGQSFDFSNHFEAFESLLRLLTEGDTPGLLVLEDIHWADAATLDLIRFLGRRVGRIRTLILITYRDEEVGSRSPLRDVLGEAPAGSIERMALEPLSLASVNRIAQKTGRRGDQIYALTGGNPFLVTEVLAVEGEAPPDAVRDATLARAARLSAEGHTVLEAVSIFPRRAETALVSGLVNGSMEAGVDACIEKGMLAYDGAALKFRHELARRAIEDALAPTRRRGLHQRVVDALKPRPDVRPSEVVHHAERAGDVAVLIEFARRAGEGAARAGAYREAASHYAAVLRHRDALDRDAIVELLERHAEQAYLMGAPEAARESMMEAARLRRQMGDAVRLGRDLTRLARFSWVSGRRAEAEKNVEEAIAVLSQTSAERELAWAYSHKAQLDMLDARPNSAIEWGQRAIALGEKLGDQELLIHALNNVGTAKIDIAGTKADGDLRTSLELARANGYHDHAERASCNLSCASYWRRDYTAALAHIENGATYACERDLTHWEAYLRGWRAMTYLDLGEWAAAETEAEEVSGWTGVPNLFRFPALVALTRLRIRRGEPDFEIPLTAARQLAAAASELQRTIYVAVLDAEQAWLNRSINAEDESGSNSAQPADAQVVSNLRRIFDLAVERGALWVASDAALWLHLLEHPVADTAGLPQPFRDQLEGRWRKAAEGWRKLGCPYEEAIALSEGDEDAQREALVIFDRLGALPAAARLRRKMRAGGAKAVPRGPIAGTRANAAGLTRRQAQVLELVGEGLSNAEIAGKLCISAKTAEHHVSAIMARLDAGTRREAADAARKMGLLADAKK